MRRMPPGMGGMGNMNNIIKQAQRMQAEAQKAQAEIEEKEFTVTAGGGMVTVVITGTREIKSVKIDPQIVDPDDVETLEDVMTAAFNEAVRTVDDFTAERMKSVTGGMNIPGL